ncbi:MAG: hypothetical protein PPP55_12740 [Halorubrum sp.]
MIPEWFPSLILFAMPASIVGYVVGRFHIRYLAFHGGESKYPAPIPETVEAYRKLNYVDELQRTSFGAMVLPATVASIALSAVTVGVVLGYFSVGYYFATMTIRGLADVEGADEPQLFTGENNVWRSTDDIASATERESVDGSTAADDDGSGDERNDADRP